MNLCKDSSYEKMATVFVLHCRCQFCLQEVYHEKSVIMNHLRYHNLDLDSYAHIYERQRLMYPPPHHQQTPPQ